MFSLEMPKSCDFNEWPLKNFSVLAKLGFCSKCSQSVLWACLFVLACSVFSEGSFTAKCSLLARLTVVNASYVRLNMVTGVEQIRSKTFVPAGLTSVGFLTGAAGRPMTSKYWHPYPSITSRPQCKLRSYWFIS